MNFQRRTLTILSILFVSCLPGSIAADSQKENRTTISNAPDSEFQHLPQTADAIVLPNGLADPLEPMNRVIWSFNEKFMTYIVRPLSKGYRLIVIKPVRQSIAKFGRNITFPGRLINNVLQGRWRGAGHESERFLCNTVVGLGGFFDPASKWNIPKADNDFGRTFAKWGWRSRYYIVLPLFGPSSDRDGIGLLTDAAANPLTYFLPYAYSTFGTGFNKLSDNVDESVRFCRSEMDAYSVAKYAGTFTQNKEEIDFRLPRNRDQASLETLQSVFLTFHDVEFPNRGKTRAAVIPATGKKLKFTCWMQPKAAPIVYIVPGLGSHRLANTSIVLAELAYQNGFSAVSVSSAFNAEFMENASSVALPGYGPVDARDLHVALTAIHRRLEGLYPNRLGQKILLGYSLGGFHSLLIAANEVTNQTALLSFDRYVAISPPVRLMFGVSQLDSFFQVPLAWPPEERNRAIERTFSKATVAARGERTKDSALPFDEIESKFLIGTAFRLTLRDVIFSSQQRNDQKILNHTIGGLRREPVYQEILQYSYEDYFRKFLAPYYLARGVDLNNKATLEEAGDLRAYASSLKANPKIELIANRNDILLAATDVQWLQDTFQPLRLKLFETGGHLGNLSSLDVQKAILDSIEERQTAGSTIIERNNLTSGNDPNSAMAQAHH